MAIWIFPNNPKKYNAEYDFVNYGKIDWTMVNNTKNVKKGDIVYLYLSSPEQKIRWKCEVIKSRYYFKLHQDEFSFTPSEEYNEGPYIELIPLIHFSPMQALEYHTLKENGLKSQLMGPQKVKDELLEYIEGVENQLQNKDIDEGYLLNLPKIIIEEYAKEASQCKIVKTKTYNRSQYISQYAKIQANGHCQLCGKKAPFNDKYGQPYLEAHHIQWLSEGGEDSVNNVIALCPNCHRKMHVINDIDDVIYFLNKKYQMNK